MRYLLMFLPVLLTGCVTGPTGPTGPERISPEELARLTLADRFERHAFYDDSQFGGAEHSLTKWDSAPSIAIASKETHDRLLPYYDDLTAVVRDIGEATGLFITPSRTGTVVLAYEPRSTSVKPLRKLYQEISSLGICGVALFREAERASSISGAVVYFLAGFEATMPGGVRPCIAQELVQAMGLPADIDGAGDTVMDSYSTLTRPTEIDKRLLQILYDPRLRSGMTREEAMPIVRQIIAENGW